MSLTSEIPIILATSFTFGVRLRMMPASRVSMVSRCSSTVFGFFGIFVTSSDRFLFRVKQVTYR